MTEPLLWVAILRNLPALDRAAKYVMGRSAHRHRLCGVYDAQDLVQDAVLKVVRNPAQVVSLGEQDKGLIALFYRTMGHVLIGWYRQAEINRTQTSDFALGVDTPCQSAGKVEPAVLRQLDQESNRQRVDSALELLAQRMPTAAIVLSYGLDLDEDQGAAEMATALGISHTNYRQRRLDGIRTLRSYVQNSQN